MGNRLWRILRLWLRPKLGSKSRWIGAVGSGLYQGAWFGGLLWASREAYMAKGEFGWIYAGLAAWWVLYSFFEMKNKVHEHIQKVDRDIDRLTDRVFKLKMDLARGVKVDVEDFAKRARLYSENHRSGR